MKREDWNLSVQSIPIGLSIVVLSAFAVLFLPCSVFAQTCWCGWNPTTGECYACPVGGGGGIVGGTGGGTGGGTIEPSDGGGAGGSGCGNCNEDPTTITESGDAPDLIRGDDWVIDVQKLFPNRMLDPGDEVTVLLVRSFPGTDRLLQPLENDGQAALYTVRIEEDGATEFDFGKIGENAVGGTYKALAVPETVGSLAEFWTELSSLPSNALNVQEYAVDNFVALDDAAALIYENGRRIDIPFTIVPDLASKVDIEFQWRKEGQQLPQAQLPLQPGIYDTILRSQDQSIMGVYAPWEFVIENFTPGLAQQFGPYFSSGEYEIDILVNGVLESTETLVVP